MIVLSAINILALLQINFCVYGDRFNHPARMTDTKFSFSKNTQLYQMTDWVRLEDIQIENGWSRRQLLNKLQKHKIQVFWKMPDNMEIFATSLATIMRDKMISAWWGYNNSQNHSSGLPPSPMPILPLDINKPTKFVCLKKSSFIFSLPYVDPAPETSYIPGELPDWKRSEENRDRSSTLYNAYIGTKLENRDSTAWVYDHIQEVIDNGAIRYPMFDTVHNQSDNGLVEVQYKELDDCSIFTENVFVVREKSDQGWGVTIELNELKIAPSDLYIFASDVDCLQSSLSKHSVLQSREQPAEVHQHTHNQYIQINQHLETHEHKHELIEVHEHNHEYKVEVHMEAPVEVPVEPPIELTPEELITPLEEPIQIDENVLRKYTGEEIFFSFKLKKMYWVALAGDAPVLMHNHMNFSKGSECWSPSVNRKTVEIYLREELHFSHALAKGVATLLRDDKKVKKEKIENSEEGNKNSESQPWIGSSSKLLAACEAAEALWKEPVEKIIEAIPSLNLRGDISQAYWERYEDGLDSVKLPTSKNIKDYLHTKEDLRVTDSLANSIAGLIRIIQPKNKARILKKTKK